MTESREITSTELADSLTARGERTSTEQARAMLQRFAIERVVEPVAPDRWRLTGYGVEVTAGLRSLETDLNGGGGA